MERVINDEDAVFFDSYWREHALRPFYGRDMILRDVPANLRHGDANSLPCWLSSVEFLGETRAANACAANRTFF